MTTHPRPASKLPELPTPWGRKGEDPGAIIPCDLFTADQMRAYGQQCAASRLAEVGGELETMHEKDAPDIWKKHSLAYAAGYNAAILAMREKKSSPGSEVRP